MNVFLLLFTDQTQAAAEGLALSRSGWNVVVTGPNDGAEVLEGENPVANAAGSWAVFASKRPLHDPND